MAGKIKFRAPLSAWDDLCVPDDLPRAELFTWLSEHSPEPEEHDLVLYTDGSGCMNGWGAWAAIVAPVEMLDGERRVLDDESEVAVGSTYGSTVARSECTAFLEGVRLALDIYATWHESLDDAVAEDGPARIYWFTDRDALARCFIFDEHDEPINDRRTEKDLWMRFSAYSRYVRITPMAVKRNSVDGQKACDALCTVARRALINEAGKLADAAGGFYNESEWNLRQNQKARSL
jgi:hypothetical protein